MQCKCRMALVFAFCYFVVCGTAFAHHGNSSYDSKNPIALKAIVTEFDWQNPHAQIYFDVKDDKGSVVHWTAETLSPSSLSRAGWTKNSIKPGDEVTIVLMPAKNGAPLGHFHEIIFRDGRKLDVGEECLYCPSNPNYKSEPKQQ